MKERSYSSLTRYIPLFDENQPARWRGRSNGFFTAYPAAVDRFVDAVCAFVAENADMALNRYHALLEKRGIKWEQYAMTRADVSRMDAQGVMRSLWGPCARSASARARWADLLKAAVSGAGWSVSPSLTAGHHLKKMISTFRTLCADPRRAVPQKRHDAGL